MFFNYEKYLSHDFSPDYWSDEGITAASTLLAGFSEEDWGMLAKSWSSKPKEWKVRCAETIDSAPSSVVVEVLLAMLHDVDADVVIAAADSLRSMPRPALRISKQRVDHLLNLRDQSGPIVKAVLDDFIKQLVRSDKE
jgi:hypothetical protein